jgi:hypothetical protein
MEYMHIDVQVGGDAFEVLDEFGHEPYLPRRRGWRRDRERGLKPACLRGIAYGLLYSVKLLGADSQDSEVYDSIVGSAGRMERIYKLDGPRGVFAELAGVDIEKVEINDEGVTIDE